MTKTLASHITCLERLAALNSARYGEGMLCTKFKRENFADA